MFGFTLPATLYKIVAEVGVVLALCIGSYFYGLHVGDLKSQVAIANFQTQKTAEETALLGINTQIQTKIVTQYVTKTVKIHDKANTIQQQIDALPPSPLLSPDWVRLHNDATGASDSVSSTTSGSSSATTGVEANRALSTITGNYATCQANAEELSDLQSFIEQQQVAITNQNKKSK